MDAFHFIFGILIVILCGLNRWHNGFIDEQRQTIDIQRAEIERLQRVLCKVEKVERGEDVLDAEIIG